MNSFDIKHEFQSLKLIIKSLLVILAVYGVIKIALVFYIQHKEHNSTPVETFRPTNVSNSYSGERLDHVVQAPIVATTEADKNSQNNALTPVETREVIDWLELRGYLSLDQRRYYENYDEKTLVALAHNGDLPAILSLVDRYLKQPDIDVEKVTYYLNEAAIRGSTTAIEGLAIFSASNYSTAESPEDKEKAAVDSLALIKTIELRGDVTLANNATERYLSQITRQYDNNFRVTPDLQNKVNQRSQEIYEDLQAKRRERGLGDFDNSTLDVIKKIFNLKN